MKLLFKLIPKKYHDTVFVRLFGFTKVPFLFFMRPSVVEMNKQKCVIKIPFKKRNKNHLNSMYFGVMCAAADLTGGYMAMKQIQKSKKKIQLSFKDFNADFKKRAVGDTYFINEQGKEISEFVKKVAGSDERMNMPVRIKAISDDSGDEVVAEFVLTLSLKNKG